MFEVNQVWLHFIYSIFWGLLWNAYKSVWQIISRGNKSGLFFCIWHFNLYRLKENSIKKISNWESLQKSMMAWYLGGWSDLYCKINESQSFVNTVWHKRCKSYRWRRYNGRCPTNPADKYASQCSGAPSQSESAFPIV